MSEPDSSSLPQDDRSLPADAITRLPSSRTSIGGLLTVEDLITLNEEIAGMARAGLPLDQGLANLASAMGRGRLQSVTQALAQDLRAGFTLPQALERQQRHVPGYYAALLAAGIRSGRIGEVLGILTLHARSVADFRDTVVTALLYPAMILLLGFGLLVFVAYTVLPAYAEIYQQMKLTLPALTRLLMFVGAHPLEVLVLPPFALVLVLVLQRWWLCSTPQGRVVWARMIYALPIVGTLLRSARLAAFTDLLGILIDQSIPLHEAFRLAAAASSDPLLTAGATQLEQEVRQGTPLAQALQRQRLVPDLVVWMIGFGEKQGTLGSALHQIAVMYRRHADMRAAMLRTILPPFLILLLAGTLSGLFIFGLMAPMYQLLEGLGGVTK